MRGLRQNRPVHLTAAGWSVRNDWRLASESRICVCLQIIETPTTELAALMLTCRVFASRDGATAIIAAAWSSSLSFPVQSSDAQGASILSRVAMPNLNIGGPISYLSGSSLFAKRDTFKISL